MSRIETRTIAQKEKEKMVLCIDCATVSYIYGLFFYSMNCTVCGRDEIQNNIKTQVA